MNYRAIFNPDYNFMGLILIASFITILLLLNKNLRYTLKIISKTFLITGIITLAISLLISFSLNTFLPYHYKIFVQVISENVIKYCISYSTICIIIGLFGYGILNIFLKEKILT